MEKTIAWIKQNIKEGTDIQEVVKLIDSEKSPEINSRELAADFIEKNRHVKAELDSRISKSVDNAIEKFKETKLPALMDEEKQKLVKELNPEETPEQKRIRELEEKIKLSESKEMLASKKEELRLKAKELNFDPLRAEKYAAYGDEAEQMLLNDAEYFQEQIKAQLDLEIKKRYGNNPTPIDGDKTILNKRETLTAEIEKAKSTGNVQQAFMLNEQLLKLPKEQNN